MPQLNYQDALLAELQKVAETLGTSTLIHKDYANTGQIIAGTPFTQYASLRFMVDSKMVQILFNGASSGTRGMSFYFATTDTTAATAMLERWRELIAEGTAQPA